MNDKHKQAIEKWFLNLKIKDKISLWNLERINSGNTDEVYYNNNAYEWNEMYGNLETFEFAQLCGSNIINSAHDYFVDTIYGPHTVEVFDAKGHIDSNVSYILDELERIDDLKTYCKAGGVECTDIVSKLLKDS